MLNNGFARFNIYRSRTRSQIFGDVINQHLARMAMRALHCYNRFQGILSTTSNPAPDVVMPMVQEKRKKPASVGVNVMVLIP